MITGDTIILRELRKGDLVVINRWRNVLQNKIIVQGFRGPVTIEIDATWLKVVLENKDNRDLYFGIEIKSSGKFVGIIQLNGIDYISGVATCGILIGEKDDRGKEIGVDAVRAVLFYAFFILNLRKVTTYIGAFNDQALKVQEKVGKITREGCLKAHYLYNGEYVDVYIQSFFRIDYDFLKNEYTF